MTYEDAQRKAEETSKVNNRPFKVVRVTYGNGEQGWDVTPVEERREDMTQAELTRMIRAAELPNGAASQVVLSDSAKVVIEAIYVHGSGAHRAWKRLYHLELDGKKIGGYDRRDSFVSWAIPKLSQWYQSIAAR